MGEEEKAIITYFAVFVLFVVVVAFLGTLSNLQFDNQYGGWNYQSGQTTDSQGNTVYYRTIDVVVNLYYEHIDYRWDWGVSPGKWINKTIDLMQYESTVFRYRIVGLEFEISMRDDGWITDNKGTCRIYLNGQKIYEYFRRNFEGTEKITLGETDIGLGEIQGDKIYLGVWLKAEAGFWGGDAHIKINYVKLAVVIYYYA